MATAEPDALRWRVGLVGYGEVGRILAEDLCARGAEWVGAYDLKLDTCAQGPLREHAAAHGVMLVASHAALAAECDLLICAVTAGQTVAAAAACAERLVRGTWFLDFNSASPGGKQDAASRIEAAGGRYVEGAVMTSVPPHRIRVPLLLGGPYAVALAPKLAALGFCPQVTSAQFGVASASKMCRSVMIKGLEALVIESLTAARAYGVEAAVLASLQETFPGIEWDRQAAYFFQRVIRHGRRRAEEMREAARTIEEAGLTPWSAAGTAERQEWMADLAETGVFGGPDEPSFARSTDWRLEADRILEHIGPLRVRGS